MIDAGVAGRVMAGDREDGAKRAQPAASSRPVDATVTT